MNSKQAAYTTLAAGAWMLSLTGVRAQGIVTPYGPLPFSALSQPYSVFGGTNGMAAFPVGPLNNGYGYNPYGLGGSTSPGASAAYFGYGLPTAFGGYPYGYAVNGNRNVYAGSNISVVDSPLSGGFAAIDPLGATFVGPNGLPSDPALMNGGNITSIYGRTGGINGVYGRKGRNANAQTGNGQDTASNALADREALQRRIGVQQDANFNLRIGWLDAPALIDTMNVTLLNQYHLPVASSMASNGLPVTFPANRDTYAARYYRVDIQFADGERATVTGKLKR